ncbi:MAG: shikimate kinase, partial [Atopobiaceae bacterium]|nr:shikimate kinase [Atopobiaceae bacterium]
RTGICLAAERLGLPSTTGLAMLVGQALRSNELFLGRALDETLIETIETDLVREMSNVVFIGMPSAGKTSTGKRFARSVGRPFVDLDCAIELSCGMGTSEYLRTYGEDEFRRVETLEVDRYGKRSGIVIACGGGVVTRPENYPLLHQNSTILLLDRPLEELTVGDRPLSQSRGITALAEERMPLYRAWADEVIACTGTADGDAAYARELLGL